MLLVGRSGVNAKSTVAVIAKEFINNLGLGYLLLPDDCSPQRMIQEMSSIVPDKYESLSIEKKERFLTGVAFAGQKGWYYDEFGMNLQNMMKSSGPYSEFRGILRKLDDTEHSYVKGTIIRGREEIERPYLSLLGALTPSDLAPFASRGSMLWGDGYFARMAIINPPNGTSIKDGEFPIGKRDFDVSLTLPIFNWHKELGLPKVSVVKGELNNNLSAIKSELDLSKETRAANSKYGKALRKIQVDDMNLPDLDGNYARFPEKALRIAALFASLSGSPEIEINHWAKAQAITERWRSNLHSLYKQVNTEEFTQQKWTDEQKILQAIKQKVFPTSREIQQYTALSSDEAGKVLEELLACNKIVRERAGKAIRFRLNL